jgi:hypothetical protein
MLPFVTRQVLLAAEVGLAELLDPQFISEDTKIKAVLLSGKRNDRLKKKFLTTFKFTATNKNVNTSVDYDRIFFLGAINGKFTFAIISESAAETQKLLSGGVGVGDVCYVFQPVFTENFLGKERMIPYIKTYYPLVRVSSQTLNEIPRKLSDVPTMSFYVLNGVHVKVDTLDFTSSCGGRTCDNQGVCFCQQKLAPTPGICLLLDLQVGDILIKSFTSLRFTELCFQRNTLMNLTVDSVWDYCNHIRRSVRTFVDDINQRNGWLVVGWYKRGQVRDIATVDDKETEEVLAADMADHITTLTPVNMNDVQENLKYSLSQKNNPDTPQKKITVDLPVD